MQQVSDQQACRYPRYRRSSLSAVFRYLDICHSAAKHMTGICEFNLYIVIDPEFHIIGHTNKKTHTGCCILLSIKRSYQWQSFFCPSLIESIVSCSCMKAESASIIAQRSLVAFEHITDPLNPSLYIYGISPAWSIWACVRII